MASLVDRLLDRLYRTQLASIALVFFVVGSIVLWVWNVFVVDSDAPRWVTGLPVVGWCDAALIGAFMMLAFEMIVRGISDLRSERKLNDAIERIFTQPATAHAVAGSVMALSAW